MERRIVSTDVGRYGLRLVLRAAMLGVYEGGAVVDDVVLGISARVGTEGEETFLLRAERRGVEGDELMLDALIA